MSFSPDGRLHSILGQSPGVSERSPPTSPPSSVAPQSDDEFTTLVIRRAAQRLGVAYYPSSGHHRATPSLTVGVHHDETDRTVLLAMSKTTELPFPGPQTWGVYGNCSIEELNKMIFVRRRALGADHSSLAPLFDALGDVYDAQGCPSLSKIQYENAAALYAPLPEHRCAVLSKLACLHLRLGNRDEFHAGFEEALKVVDASKQQAKNSPVPENNQLLEILLRATDLDDSRAKIASRLMGARQRPTERGIAVQTEDAILVSHEPRFGVFPATSSEHQSSLSEDQLNRIRGPSTRDAADLRSLMNYLSDRKSGGVTQRTADVVENVRKRMHVADSTTSSARLMSPRRHPTESRSVEKLIDTLRGAKYVRAVRTGEEMTENEVARMLLETSMFASPYYNFVRKATAVGFRFKITVLWA